jgi:hypothetical protein
MFIVSALRNLAKMAKDAVGYGHERVLLLLFHKLRS